MQRVQTDQLDQLKAEWVNMSKRLNFVNVSNLFRTPGTSGLRNGYIQIGLTNHNAGFTKWLYKSSGGFEMVVISFL